VHKKAELGAQAAFEKCLISQYEYSLIKSLYVCNTHVKMSSLSPMCHILTKTKKKPQNMPERWLHLKGARNNLAIIFARMCSNVLEFLRTGKMPL